MKKYMFLIATVTILDWLTLSSCSNSRERVTKLLDPVETEATNGQVNSKAGIDINSVVNAKTQENIMSSRELLDVYKGEMTASAKYTAQSKQAEREGYHSIALLFKAASSAERIHAGNHKAVMEEAGIKVPSFKPEFTVQSTKKNLEDAIKGESYEAKTMYPEYLKNEVTAGNKLAILSITYAFRTEQKHQVMFNNALTALANGTSKTLPSVYYICPNCGNTLDATPMLRCDICLTNSERFIRVNSLKSPAE